MAAPAFQGHMDMAGDGAEAETTGTISMSAGLINGFLDEDGNAEKQGGKRKEAAMQASAAGGGSFRTDFRETTFFFPDLLTDRDGEVVLRFTMPDALTRWYFMGVDIVVCDGFVGNVALKATKGVATMIGDFLGAEFARAPAPA